MHWSQQIKTVQPKGLSILEHLPTTTTSLACSSLLSSQELDPRCLSKSQHGWQKQEALATRPKPVCQDDIDYSQIKP